jgi:hypothetical protein
MSQYDKLVRPKPASPRNGSTVNKRCDHDVSISAESTLQSSIDFPQSVFPSTTADQSSAESDYDRGQTPIKSTETPSKDAAQFAVASEIRHTSSSELFDSLNEDATKNPLAVDDDISQNAQSDTVNIVSNGGKMADMAPGAVHRPQSTTTRITSAHTLPLGSGPATSLRHPKKSSMSASTSRQTIPQDLEESVDVNNFNSDALSAAFDASTQNETAKGRDFTVKPARSRVFRILFNDRKDSKLFAVVKDLNMWKCSCIDLTTIRLGRKPISQRAHTN